MIQGGLIAGHTIAHQLFCVRLPFTLADPNRYHEDEVFDSSFLMSPNEMIRPPKSPMGFLAMTSVYAGHAYWSQRNLKIANMMIMSR